MYCRKCGYRLVSGEKTCQNCGEPAAFAEYCGGFWGLVGKEGAGKASSATCREELPVTVQAISEIKNNAGQEKTKDKKSFRNKAAKIGITAMALVCSVFVILFAVQTFRISTASKKLLEIEEKYAALEENYAELKEESDAATAENASLLEELDRLSDENAVLSEENARLREAPWNIPSRWHWNSGLMQEDNRQDNPELPEEETEGSTDDLLSSETPQYDDLTKTEESGDVEDE